MYKYSILSLHIFIKSHVPITIRKISERNGYVRHTIYNGNMCRTNIIDNSLDYLEKYLIKIYNKFENLFQYKSVVYYYGK